MPCRPVKPLIPAVMGARIRPKALFTGPCATMRAMRPIAHIHTDLPQKFGIPRNSFLAPHLLGRIVFEPEFALDSAVAGLDAFTHLWLIWQFENGTPGGTAADIAADAATRNKAGTNDSWSPTVRPPRLGGSERVGVFATRSPFRPNPIGLTCVKLDRVELTDKGPVIHVLGADLRDGTPILDIKPYIPFADCHPDATGGWIEQNPWQELEVDFPDDLRGRIEADKLSGLIEVLRQDPRRAGSKHDPARVYHLAYAGHDVSFTVDGPQLSVVAIDAN
jgi:tRNA (adenine37-N6)-methyltransferase